MSAEIRHFDAGIDGVQIAGIYIVVGDQPVIGPFRNVWQRRSAACIPRITMDERAHLVIPSCVGASA